MIAIAPAITIAAMDRLVVMDEGNIVKVRMTKLVARAASHIGRAVGRFLIRAGQRETAANKAVGTTSQPVSGIFLALANWDNRRAGRSPGASRTNDGTHRDRLAAVGTARNLTGSATGAALGRARSARS